MNPLHTLSAASSPDACGDVSLLKSCDDYIPTYRNPQDLEQRGHHLTWKGNFSGRVVHHLVQCLQMTSFTADRFGKTLPIITDAICRQPAI